MKLLRTTTSNETGLFDSFLNQDLIIEPYSKIALGQISASVRQDSIIIDGTNDTFTFSTKAGADRIVKFTHGTYNNQNFNAFLEELADKIDKSIGVFAYGTSGGNPDTNKVIIADANNIGKESRFVKTTAKPDSGKLTLQINQSTSWSHVTELTTNIYKEAGTAQLEFTGTGSTEDNLRLRSAIDTTDSSYKRATFFSSRLAQGVGVFRVRLNKLDGNAATNQGYTIGILATNPATFMTGSAARALTLNDFYLGISAVDPYDATGNYGVIDKSGAGGSVVVTPAAPAVTPNNSGGATEKDVASIEICNGRLRLVIYQHDAANPTSPHTRVIHDEPFDGRPYYGVIVVHGKQSQTELRNIKFTGNPFSDTSAPNLNFESDPDYVGASTPGRQSRARTNNAITFPNLTVSQWFGYEGLTYTQQGTPDVSFVADTLFKAAIENDLYLVEMLNIQLESYDTFDEGRKNILGVVPYDDINSKVAYDPNNLIFLDLNNKQSINLTSIRFRLVRADYSAPELIGLTTAVLYFKGKDEL